MVAPVTDAITTSGHPTAPPKARYIAQRSSYRSQCWRTLGPPLCSLLGSPGPAFLRSGNSYRLHLLQWVAAVAARALRSRPRRRHHHQDGRCCRHRVGRFCLPRRRHRRSLSLSWLASACCPLHRHRHSHSSVARETLGRRAPLPLWRKRQKSLMFRLRRKMTKTFWICQIRDPMDWRIYHGPDAAAGPDLA